eukprot:12701387-Alexandrium_andersonii.AAC.1
MAVISAMAPKGAMHIYECLGRPGVSLLKYCRQMNATTKPTRPALHGLWLHRQLTDRQAPLAERPSASAARHPENAGRDE